MENYKLIRLENGGQVLVSAEDYDELSQIKWFKSSGGYAHRQGWHKQPDGTRVHWDEWMHRRINKTPDGLFTDHINGNKLDNRRENLRTVNKSQNSANRPKIKRPQLCSTYKGVSLHRSTGLWRARVCSQTGNHNTYHKTEIGAAIDYNRMALEVFGECAQLNVIPEGAEPSVPFKAATTSKYRGVCWLKREKRWLAKIEVNTKKIYLGTFKLEDDAARAYNEGAKLHFGEHAKLNEIYG